MGDTKGGSFDIPGALAEEMLSAPLNPNARSNADVIKPWVNAADVSKRSRGMWIIDFGTMNEQQAALYERPFEYVRTTVQPERTENRRQAYRMKWWIHAEPRPAMKKALSCLNRFIATISVGKHRHFVWLPSRVVPDHQLLVFARDDDYFFGILHSFVHEMWARASGANFGKKKADSDTHRPPRSKLSPFLGPPEKNRRKTRALKPSPMPLAISCKNATHGSTRPTRRQRNCGTEEAHPNQPLQPESHLASGRPPRTGHSRAPRLRLANRHHQSGNPSPTS